MKAKITLFTALTLVFALVVNVFTGSDAHSYSSGPPAGRTGSPGDGGITCNTSGCHTGATVNTLSGLITSDVPTTGYVPGATYTITAQVIRPGHSKFGFQVSPQNTTGTLLGTLLLTNTTQTQLAGVGKYVQHTSSGTAGTGSKTWTFNWKAPASNTGAVTFYGTFNASNSSFTSLGDTIFKSTLSIPENVTTGTDELALLQTSLSVFPNPATDHINVNYSLNRMSHVEIALLDLEGRLIIVIENQEKGIGSHTVSADVLGTPKGFYLMRISAGDQEILKKFVIQ